MKYYKNEHIKLCELKFFFLYLICLMMNKMYFENFVKIHCQICIVFNRNTTELYQNK